VIGAESLPSGAVVRPFSVLYRLKSIEKRFVGEEIEIKFSRVGIALSGPFDLFAAMCMFGACLGNVLDYARGFVRVEQSWCDRARGRWQHAGGSGISRRMLRFADFSLAFASVNCRAWIVVRM